MFEIITNPLLVAIVPIISLALQILFFCIQQRQKVNSNQSPAPSHFMKFAAVFSICFLTYLAFLVFRPYLEDGPVFPTLIFFIIVIVALISIYRLLFSKKKKE